MLSCQLCELLSEVLIIVSHGLIGLLLGHILEMSNGLISPIDPAFKLVLAIEPAPHFLLALSFELCQLLLDSIVIDFEFGVFGLFFAHPTKFGFLASKVLSVLAMLSLET